MLCGCTWLTATIRTAQRQWGALKGYKQMKKCGEIFISAIFFCDCVWSMDSLGRELKSAEIGHFKLQPLRGESLCCCNNFPQLLVCIVYKKCLLYPLFYWVWLSWKGPQEAICAMLSLASLSTAVGSLMHGSLSRSPQTRPYASWASGMTHSSLCLTI